jgi:outer membrane lipoprotein-sorting protein
MSRSIPTRVCVLGLALLPLSGCLFHSRRLERQVSNAPLMTATQQELIVKLSEEADKIKTLQATVDIDTSVANEAQSTVTDYKEIRGYVLLRKPAMLRMIGLMPIVRNKAFDMVSDGQQFKVWIPPKNKFVIGTNSTPPASGKPSLETMRPEDIYDALLVEPIDTEKEIAVVENGYETVIDPRRHRVDQPDYELVVIRRGAKGWYLSRRIVFSRTDLKPHRQLIYDEDGRVRTEALYEKYTDYDHVWLPAAVQIHRPIEGYDITLNMLKMEVNKSLTNEQFQLDQPTGSEVVHVGQPADSGSAHALSDGGQQR